jgi:hypothetical protein
VQLHKVVNEARHASDNHRSTLGYAVFLGDKILEVSDRHLPFE